MSTAQIIYEQYKVLPKRVRQELKALMIKEKAKRPLSLMEEIEESLKQVKLIRDGKMPKKNMRDLLNVSNHHLR